MRPADEGTVPRRLRPDIGAAWMAARARNAGRRLGLIGGVGTLVLVAALLALVLVPRGARRAARFVAPPAEAYADTVPLLAADNRASQQLAAAESAYAADERRAQPRPLAVADTATPPWLVAQRDSIAVLAGQLAQLVQRAENAPLPASYRQLGQSPYLTNDPRVQPLLDSLDAVERERDSFDAVTGVDPTFVLLTTRATEIGRAIQALGEEKLADMRRQMAALRPAPRPAAPTFVVDTARHRAAIASARFEATLAARSLASARQQNAALAARAEQAQALSHLGAPAGAMLGAALVLALVVGFGVSLLYEVNRPKVSDAREAERVAGVRVLAVVRDRSDVVDRNRRRADFIAPPLVDPANESYRLLYLHLAATGSSLPLVTIAGDDADVTATIGVNLAVAAAYEARGTLLVDADPAHARVARVLRVRSVPGLSGVISGRAGWPEAIVPATVGRDRTLDVIPAGARGDPIDERGAAVVREGLARLARRYDLTVVVAPPDAARRLAEPDGDAPPDVIVCARIGHTTLTTLSRNIALVHEAGARLRGVVLWEREAPRIEESLSPPPSEVLHPVGSA